MGIAQVKIVNNNCKYTAVSQWPENKVADQ